MKMKARDARPATTVAWDDDGGRPTNPDLDASATHGMGLAPAGTFDPAVRAAEKQASRDADARALASGEKSRAQLKAENGAFAFPRDRVRICFPRRG
jgi:hypothetical protein